MSGLSSTDKSHVQRLSCLRLLLRRVRGARGGGVVRAPRVRGAPAAAARAREPRRRTCSLCDASRNSSASQSGRLAADGMGSALPGRAPLHAPSPRSVIVDNSREDGLRNVSRACGRLAPERGLPTPRLPSRHKEQRGRPNHRQRCRAGARTAYGRPAQAGPAHLGSCAGQHNSWCAL